MLKYRVGEGTAVEEFWLFISNLVDDANRKILFTLVNVNVSNRPNDSVDTVELLLFVPEIHELHSVACSQKCTLLWLRVYLRWSAAKICSQPFLNYITLHYSTIPHSMVVSSTEIVVFSWIVGYIKEPQVCVFIHWLWEVRVAGHVVIQTRMWRT
jgi:hypothetical protein